MSTVQPQSVEDQTYDVFISYSHRDAEWVRNWLLPRLERAGLSVCIDFRDFQIGVPSLVNMERAAERSQRTLLVLTPNWVQSEWTNFEALMIQTQGPVGLRRRMLPLMLEECVLPGRLAIFTYADFRERENWEAEVSRLLHQIGEESGTPFVDLNLAAEEPTPIGPERVSLAKLPSTSPDLFGRAGELAMLDTAWDDPRTNVISVFVSYSHKDEEWKDRLVTHLGVLHHQGLLDLWDDRRIGAGEDWYQEIQQAMAAASVAILLVSANFLTSRFILGKEVPRLLERRDKEGLRIFPVIVKPCAWQTVGWLSRMQARPKDGRPLSAGDEHQIETDLAAIATEVHDLLKP